MSEQQLFAIVEPTHYLAIAIGIATILAAALDLVSQANVNVGTHAEQGGHDCAQAAPDDETKKPTCD